MEHYTPPKCPEHPQEYMETTTLYVKTPDYPRSITLHMINYCKQSNKYLNIKGELVSKEESALEFINKIHKKDYNLSDIEIISLEDCLELNKSREKK